MIVYASGTETEKGAITISVARILLTLAAPVAVALVSMNLLLGDRVLFGRSRDGAHTWADGNLWSFPRHHLEEAQSVVGMIIASYLTVPPLLVAAAVEAGGVWGMVSPAVLEGFLLGFFSGPAGLLLRRAHMVSNRRQVIALQYLSPLMALGWLQLGTGIDIPHVWLLVLGTLGIVATNILFDTKR